MWNWLTNNLVAVFLAVALLATLLYALRLRAKMSTSKARFAFVASATLASCLIAFLNFLYGSGPVWVGNKILSGVKIISGNSGIPDSLRK